MHSKWVFNHFQHQPRWHLRPLAVLWLVGLFAGILLCCIRPDDSVDILRSAMLTSPSPMYLFLVDILPVAVIVISIITPFYGLAYFAVLLSAVCHGFSGVLIYISNGSSAWLLRPLLLFSASCASALIWWLLLISKKRRCLRRNIRFACFLSCLVFLADWFIISPLLGDLAKYF